MSAIGGQRSQHRGCELSGDLVFSPTQPWLPALWFRAVLAKRCQEQLPGVDVMKLVSLRVRISREMFRVHVP